MSLEELGTLMKMLTRAYPTAPQSLDGDTIKMYLTMLKDLPTEPLALVIQQHIATSKFFPTVAELREPTLDLIQKKPPSAFNAWIEVSSLIAAGHCYLPGGAIRRPIIDNPITNKILEKMNFRQFYFLPTQKQERIFKECYEELRAQEIANSRSLPEVRAIHEKQALKQLKSAVDTEARVQEQQEKYPELDYDEDGDYTH
jgi:hypothetical protein